MIEYNKTIANLLKNVSNTNEGALLNNSDGCIQLQVELIERCLEKYRPKHIVETGTNKGYFSFIALSILDKYPEEVLINTFDMNQFSANAVQIVNSTFNRHKVVFHLGDSTVTVKNFNPQKKVDLFFVDGGHTHYVATSDIKQAKRMNSPLILIDDTGGQGVAQAIAEQLSDYKIIDETERSDDRRMKLYGKIGEIA